jgi:ketosteroid isomerase-like protein
MQLLSGPMKFLPGAAAIFLLSATHSRSELPATDPNARSLAAAESAFAAESVALGMRTAFLNVLSEDAIVFEPDPQNGRKAWTAKKDSAAVLSWKPILAVVAASGDFGYTTGPWTYKAKAEDREAVAFGQFVSIWRREAGQWKLLFDLGADHPAPTAAAPDLQVIDNRSPNEPAAAAREAMFKNDRAYAAAPLQEFPRVAADDIRLFLPQKFPVLGKSAAEAALRGAPEKLTFGAPKGEISPSGDLGFAWGGYRGPQDGYYLRIWRRHETAAWTLVLELLHPR